MTNISWCLDKQIGVLSDGRVQVLQRPLLDIRDAIENEFVPFLGGPTFMGLSSNAGHKIYQVVGGIASIKVLQETDLQLKIMSSDPKVYLQWHIDRVSEIVLTVWRVNAVLDTLQINVYGKDISLYMQTGGSMLTQIFSSNHLSLMPNVDVLELENLFIYNALPRKVGE